MPSEPLRFIHASRLMLDHQLRGVGGAPPEARGLIEDATLIAFERVIDACLAHSVDFLLLVGDSFERNDQGLRGQSALARGLERLEEKNIPAFVTSGRRDPWSAWLPGLRFSENVTRIDPNAMPASFEREGRTLARVCSLDATANTGMPATRPLGGDAPYSIALVYWDDALRLRTADDRHKLVQEWLDARRDLRINYWALGGGHSACTWPVECGLAHDPGSPQALRSGEAGSHGCTLWELNGQARSTFIPTSPVRFESRHVTLLPHWHKDDLIGVMHQSLRGLEPQATDRVWAVSWRFDGEGSLFDCLASPAFRSELVEALQGECVPGVTTVHDFRIPVYVPQAFAEGDRFSQEYTHALAERGWSPAAILAESAARGTIWESRLVALLSELEDREIATSARGAGLRWFATPEGVSA